MPDSNKYPLNTCDVLVVICVFRIFVYSVDVMKKYMCVKEVVDS